MEEYLNEQRFIDDANDLVLALEKALLALESGVIDESLTEEVFRTMHTLKGAANMFGFTHINELTHNLENVFSGFRSAGMFDRAVLTTAYESVDLIKNLLNYGRKGEIGAELTEAMQEMIARCELMLKSTSGNGDEAGKGAPETFLVRIRPAGGLQSQPNSPLVYLVEELCGLGPSECKFAQSAAGPESPVLYLGWDVYLATGSGENTVRDVFLFVEDDCRLEVVLLAKANAFSVPEFVAAVAATPYDAGAERLELLAILANKEAPAQV